jgi:hypothetical protein
MNSTPLSNCGVFDFQMANSPSDCVRLITAFNTAIRALFEIDNIIDTDPFNSCSHVNDAMRKVGVESSFYFETADKLELARALLLSNVLDTDRLTELLGKPSDDC